MTWMADAHDVPWWDTSWLQAVAALVLAVGVLLGTVIGRNHVDGRVAHALTVLGVKVARAEDAATATTSSLTNDHGTHLRDDIDAITKLVRSTAADVTRLRESLGTLTDMVTDLDRRGQARDAHTADVVEALRDRTNKELDRVIDRLDALERKENR